MKRTSLQRKTPLRAKTPLKRSGFKNKGKVGLERKTRLKPTAGAKKVAKQSKQAIPKWLKAVPESKAHGSGTYQKRLWKLTSDYVRIRDWHKYGVCVATGTKIEHYKDGHAGHLKPYSTCNAIFKFDVRNIHMQHGNSNKFGNYDTFRDFEKVVKNRGYDWDKFERENNKANGSRLYDSDVIKEAKKVLTLMKKLPEQPEYFERAYNLLQE